MEMADAIVINKADGDNIDKANLAATHFRNALHLFPPTESGWRPKVLTYSGFYGLGIKEIWDMSMSTDTSLRTQDTSRRSASARPSGGCTRASMRR